MTRPDLSAVPGVPPTVMEFVAMIREFMRDYPELNRLIAGEESSDRMILWALLDTIEDFNATPPPLSFRYGEIPRHILRLGVVRTLLESVLLLNTRNSLAYSDGGIQVSLERTGPLMQLHQLMEARYEQKKRDYKISQNIARCYRSIASEYWSINGFYGAW